MSTLPAASAPAHSGLVPASVAALRAPTASLPHVLRMMGKTEISKDGCAVAPMECVHLPPVDKDGILDPEQDEQEDVPEPPAPMFPANDAPPAPVKTPAEPSLAANEMPAFTVRYMTKADGTRVVEKTLLPPPPAVAAAPAPAAVPARKPAPNVADDELAPALQENEDEMVCMSRDPRYVPRRALFPPAPCHVSGKHVSFIDRPSGDVKVTMGDGAASSDHDQARRAMRNGDCSVFLADHQVLAHSFGEVSALMGKMERGLAEQVGQEGKACHHCLAEGKASGEARALIYNLIGKMKTTLKQTMRVAVGLPEVDRREIARRVARDARRLDHVTTAEDLEAAAMERKTQRGVARGVALAALGKKHARAPAEVELSSEDEDFMCGHKIARRDESEQSEYAADDSQAEEMSETEAEAEEARAHEFAPLRHRGMRRRND